MDIADQLDAAIGTAPPEAPGLTPTLALGRRALRRRRLAYGIGAATTTLVIGGAAWAIAPGDASTDVRDDSLVAGPSTRQVLADDQVAGYDPRTGELTIGEGWHVIDRVDGPITGPAPSDFGADEIDKSVALAATDGSEEQWVLAWYDDDNGADSGIAGTVTGQPGDEFQSFRRWVDYESTVLQSGPDSEVWGPEAAMLNADGTLVTKPGWRIATRTEDPSGPGSLAVDMTDGTEHQWFVFDREGMEISDIHTDPAHPGSPDADYESFADWVSAMVAATDQPPGEGTR